MNRDSLSKHYGSLSPEETFRLILAASGRGDEAEKTRLAHAVGRITLWIPSHFPYAQGFNELAGMTFMELVEDAACYAEILTYRPGGDADEDADGDDADTDAGDADAGDADAADGKLSSRVWRFDLALARGWALKTKIAGWKLFCERLCVPPYLVWGVFPGWARLERVLALAEHAAFEPEGMMRWLNRLRPSGTPALADLPLTPEGMADDLALVYQSRARWWGGAATSQDR